MAHAKRVSNVSIAELEGASTAKKQSDDHAIEKSEFFEVYNRCQGGFVTSIYKTKTKHSELQLKAYLNGAKEYLRDRYARRWSECNNDLEIDSALVICNNMFGKSEVLQAGIDHLQHWNDFDKVLDCMADQILSEAEQYNKVHGNIEYYIVHDHLASI